MLATKLTHNLNLCFSSPLFISYSSCDVHSLYSLQPASLGTVPDIDGHLHIQDEHISTVHGAPCKTGLVGEERGEEEIVCADKHPMGHSKECATEVLSN